MIKRLASGTASAALFILAGCGSCNGDCTAPPPPPQRQFVVAVDLSGSITQEERAANQDLLSKFMRTLSFGDRLVVMEAHARGVKGANQPFQREMPVPEFGGQPTQDDDNDLADAVKMAQPQAIKVLGGPTVNGTDLFATLHSVADRMREAPGRKTSVVMMSDMLQCTPELCIENGRGTPDSSWIAARKAQNGLPDLTGACIVVVGADVTAPTGPAVRDFWIAYFRAAGAELRADRYSYQVGAPGRLNCQDH